MNLYFSPGACSLAAHIALNASGLPNRRVKVDLKTRTTEQGDDFTAINPKGYVPALELDDGQVLTENIAVLAYIGSLAPMLFPQSGMPHWRTLETLAFISTELHKGFKPFFDSTADEDARDKARKQLSSRFDLMEKRLGDRAFIVGESLTVADCYLFVTLNWARGKAAMDLPPHLSAYFERLEKHPAVGKALSEEGLR